MAAGVGIVQEEETPLHKPARIPAAEREDRFVAEYLIDLNATHALQRTGLGPMSPGALRVQACKMLARPRVAAKIAAAQAKRSARTGITTDAVLARLWDIATADPRELIEYRRTCCRHCHGADFGYQRTTHEMARERAAWEKAQTKRSLEQFDELGGVGYNGTLPPHADCPECFGEGVERVYVHDTRHLKASALVLYAGVKTTKDGLEIKMHDQAAALVNVGKHLGMFTEKPPEPPDATAVAAKVREALRAMLAADGLQAA